MLACTREVPKVRFTSLARVTAGRRLRQKNVVVMTAADRMFDFLLVSSNGYLDALATLEQDEVRAVMRSVED